MGFPPATQNADVCVIPCGDFLGWDPGAAGQGDVGSVLGMKTTIY